MCGIFGFNWKNNKLLLGGLDKLKHRGPDDSGIFNDGKVSLGHSRLSIIDLSKSGKQPMSNEDKSIWITFNGEIYNYKELKNGLGKKHIFSSNTDTEVLVHLYEEKGISMLQDLLGMFSFCIYDKKKRILFLSRDRLGIKPLYYFSENGKFIFSSEIKAILEDKNIKREVNLNALNSYLTFRANTKEETFFKGIKKLPPGHLLIYNLINHRAEIKKYWDISFEPKPASFDFYKNKLRSLIEESVKIRLMSDVPYGVYLSGGVDSGIIAALVNKFSKEKPIKTFSVGFKEEKHTETNEARFLANHLKTSHHELLIDENSIKKLPEIIYQSDEPIADPTAIPIYFLSEYAKKYCTVILTGEGADEIFAGYPQYKFMKIHESIISKLPEFLRDLLPMIAKFTPNIILNKLFRFSSALGEKGLERFSNYVLSNSKVEQYFNQVAIFSQDEQKELLGKDYNLYDNYAKYFKNSADVLSGCEELELKEPMVEDLLMKVDKNTMAFGVEGRVPFLDHRVVELCAEIPPTMKLRGLKKDKYILREAFSDIVPSQTLKRKKRHFFVPIESWIENELSPLRNKLLSREYIEKQNIFNGEYIEVINLGFEKSKLYYSRQLWALLVFQIWYKQYIENEEVKI